MSRLSRSRATRALLAAALTLASAPLVAQEAGSSDVIEFNIEPQALTAALNDWSEQAGLQVVWPAGGDAKSGSSTQLQGRFDPMQALQLLLRGSGLTYLRINERTVVIRERAQSAPPSVNTTHLSYGAARPSLQFVRLQTDATAVPKSQSAGKDEWTLRAEPDEDIEELVVTGSHIRGVNDVAAPTTVLDRESFERRGQVTLEEAMADLPQNFNSINAGGGTITGGSRLSFSNSDLATGIDLRGLGAGSTLTLLNGSRRAGRVAGQVVDISAIPLSMIERIEVVSGGRSAIYGTDAVGGVVNLILRRDFEGLEVTTTGGMGEHGGDQVQVSSLGGAHWDQGGVVVGYDFRRQWELNLVEAGFAVNDRYDNVPLRREATPNQRRHSALVSGHHRAADWIELSFDALYTWKEFESLNAYVQPGAINPTTTFVNDESVHYSVSTGADISLGTTWNLGLKGTLSRVETDQSYEAVYDYGTEVFESSGFGPAKVVVDSVSATAEGPLFSLGNLQLRLAIGAEHREEHYFLRSDSENFTYNDDGRSVSSAFSEVLIPISDANASFGSVNLSLAGRYDDYSDFGDTFNRQAGLVWKPNDRYTLRAAYATAFRAPAIVELAAYTYLSIYERPDPASATGFSPVLEVGGVDPNIGPERAKTWSVGFDYTPPLLDRFKVSMSFFSVNYRDRIDIPAIGGDLDLILEREGRFQGLIDRSPSGDSTSAWFASTPASNFYNSTAVPFDPEAENIVDVFPGLIVFDNRTTNSAIERARVVDLSISGEFPFASGTGDFLISTTYTVDHDRRVTASSPALDLVNEVGKPTDLRVRSDLGWKRAFGGVNLGINYYDRYSNPYAAPVGSIGSWTTVDLTLHIDTSSLGAAWASGLRASLSVSNLLDEDPPFFGQSDFGLTFDGANANAQGRFFVLQLGKRW